MRKRPNLLLGWNMILNKLEINFDIYPEKDHHPSSWYNNERVI